METQSHHPVSPPGQAADVAARRAAIVLIAEATVSELEAGLAAIDEFVEVSEIRPAETGLMMVRGRIGGDGAPFNLGEATVTRCAIQLASGEIGHAYVLGRDRDKARLAALIDALWQTTTWRAAVERHVLEPVRARRDGERTLGAARSAATKVDFFTLVRGEN